ncbi:amino acid/polyamine/organocation transporter, APC superfamily [Terribacillus aidingensis]|uniref:Amino acid/polyamine/organocation transporter, APC superfamily n=1 Tax=Terribacillus aidingensis TaxID=586416 RepID=A0A285PCR7_9BACI|nr:APC family permease [Terribacillus aidingensis]SNZ17641.1 amino acid/polyamine/organocation transporter, APC superfamily [Terribacillus aidingensis]
MSKQQLKKTMSKTDVIFLAVGAMLGWGWVVLSGDWIINAGFLGSIIAFALGGLLICLIGLTYAELSSSMPETGGGLVFVNRAYGRKLGFVAAWSVLAGYVTVITFEAVALPTVIDYVVPVHHVGHLWTLNDWPVYTTWVLIGSGGALLLTLLNYIGAKPAAIFQSVFTVLMIATAILLLFGASINGSSANLQPFFTDGTAGVITVLVMVPFLFVGFDVVPQVAEEIDAPAKTISRILMISIVCAVLFYLLIVYGVSAALPQAQLENSSLATADAMAALFGSQVFGTILVIGGVAGIITSWNAFIIGASRILYAMADRKMIPVWFMYIHPKYGTPTNAILFLGAMAFFAPLLGRPALVWIVNAGGVGMIVGYMLVALAFLRLRKMEPDLKRPYKIKYWRTIGSGAVVMSFLFLSFYLPGMPAALVWPYEWMMLIGWTIIGLVLYVITNRKLEASSPERSIANDKHA